MPKEKRPLTAQDLYNFTQITSLDISPEGRFVILGLQRTDQESEKKYSNLWITATDSGETHQFTFGDQVDNKPKWSPDGNQIAFLSNRGDKKQPQIYIIPTGGGEAYPLTDLKGEFESLAWSPDGKKILCQFRKKDPEAIERETDEKKKELGIVHRHIDRVYYKFDGYGFLPKERWHLWTIDVETGEANQVTDSPIYDERFPCWSPDGEWIAFISNRSPDPDLAHNADDLYVVSAEGGSMRKIEAPEGVKLAPSFSPDGNWITYVGKEGRKDWWRNQNLWIVPSDGSGEATNLTDKFDFDVSESTINDMNVGGLVLIPPTWSPDGKSIYFQVARHGTTSLKSISPDGQNLISVIAGDGVVGAYAFDKAFEKLAYFYGTMSDPGQIWTRDMKSNQSHQRTQLNQHILGEVDLGQTEEVWFEGPDGNKLQGWIIKPPGFDPNQQYPSIMEIHGGPLTQYGHFFMHEFFFLAAQGYVVYFGNPRGGQGYGEEHAKAIWGNWGSADYADLMAWADYMTKQPYIDTDRMGVTGGSYGGYMSLWIIGHTQRFKAAVAQRVVSNFVSMWGSSDLNWVFQEIVNDKPPWEDLEGIWFHSPMAYIGNAKTPTLIIHSEHDHRCPIEQGEQAFVALKTLGVDSEMIRFPEEPHGLSRAGRTDRRITRLNHILRWFDKYLKPA
jgi:dipeptidyl aminopeptidase/acylaminoacyl peptidase